MSKTQRARVEHARSGVSPIRRGDEVRKRAALALALGPHRVLTLAPDANDAVVRQDGHCEVDVVVVVVVMPGGGGCGSGARAVVVIAVGVEVVMMVSKP